MVSQHHPILPKLADSTFALNLFRAAVKRAPRQNVLVSPTSITVLLHMVHRGATDGTRQELAAVLGLSESSDTERSTPYCLDSLRWAQLTAQLRLAASLWIALNRPVRTDYIATVRKQLGCEIYELDFSSSTAAARINKWICDVTNGAITDPMEELDPNTVLAGVTAVFFKGKWLHPFDRGSTDNRVFHAPDGTRKQLPFMHMKAEFSHAQTDEFQAVCLPYTDGRLAMYIFLPSSAGLTSLCRQLTPERWGTWLDSFGSSEGTLELPRFKVNYSTDLASLLSRLDVSSMFDPIRAELGGITDRRLWLGEMRHSASLKVDEEGTEAAAVSYCSTIFGAPVREFIMVVNRPFLCAIVDRTSGTILFLGAIFDPAAVADETLSDPTEAQAGCAGRQRNSWLHRRHTDASGWG